jgi:glyoxylase-like metal-dependent hydrolase (beta-lactamase superfamily II)
MVNEIKISTIDTGTFGLDGGSMFGVVPKPLWTKAYSEADEMNRIPLASRPLLILESKRKILIDTGNGNKFNEKQQKIYKIDLDKSNIINSLSKHNIRPEDITDVILTHLHFDHCGGSTIWNDGNLVPTFPNAKYYVQKEQWDWALSPTEKDRASFIRDDFVPLSEHNKIEFTKGRVYLTDTIEVIPFYGHTKAMQGVKIHLNDQIYFYAADLFPTSAHIHLPYILAYDNFPLTTLQEKKEILKQAVEEDWIIIFEHDAFVKAAKVGLKDGNYFIKEKIDL